MTRKSTAALAVFMIGAVIVLTSGWLIAGRGFSSREQPTMLETFIAGRMRSLATPRAASEANNPVAHREEVLSEAMGQFSDHCATCHANDGSGDTSIGRGLYPKPPDMRQAKTQNLTDGEIFYIIHNGIRLTGMPAFGGDGPPDQDLDSWKLVH